MRRSAAILMSAAALCGTVTASAAERVTFTQQPTAVKTADGGTITFAVSAATDVEVSVLNAKGRAVRHLAAGVLGDQAPSPLKVNSLDQSLLWDGTDDAGRPAEGGPFQVRVAVGLKPVYDGKMFDQPQNLMGLDGLAAGPGGVVYTKGGGKDGGMGPAVDLRVYSREGAYLRTIAPYPAGLERGRVAPLGAFPAGADEYIPRVYDMRAYSFYPADLRPPRLTQMAADAEGRVFFLAGGPQRLHVCVLDHEGGVPAGWTFAGKGLYGEDGPKFAVEGFLAVSADGKRVYVCGAHAGRGKASVPAVFWTDAKERGPATVLAGDVAESGSADGRFSDPQGVAVDGAGHVLVADRGNGRVCVIAEKDGAFVASFPVPDADKVQVDPATGAVYVLTFSKKGSDLVKFSNWREHKEVARVSLGGGGAGMAPFLAVSGGEKPVAWVGSNGYRRYTLLRIPDLGETFGEPKEMSPAPAPLVEDVFVDRLRDEVYVNLGPRYWRFKDGTQQAEEVPIDVHGNSGLTLRVGPHGTIYGHAWGDKLHRWDRNGTPVPFEQTGTNILEIPSQMTYQLRGLFVDQLKGEVNIIQPNARRKISTGVNPDCFGSVMRVYDLDGNFKREAIHSLNFQASVGPRVDPAGNIYVGEPARPGSHELPEFFRGKIADIKVEREDQFYVPSETFAYSWAYGSILKFSPQGGSVLWGNVAEHKEYKRWTGDVPGAVNPVLYSQNSEIRIRKAATQGVVWARGGFFPLTSRVGCNCLASYFDVDYFGRVFYPDAGQSRVGVLDTNGNVITHFGRYGNRDAKGKDDYVPLAMGLAVAATGRHIYVGDIINQCLVRVKMTWAAEAACEIE